MKSSPFDVDLLRFFVDLMEGGVLVRSGARFAMSPASASRALDRLREIFNDKLFVRVNTGLAPTQRALDLLPEVIATINKMEELLQPREFIPRETLRNFKIAANGFAFSVIIPGIVSALLRQAPKASIEVVPLSSTVAEDLRDGAVDLAVMPDFNPPADCHLMRLIPFSLLCLMRAEHPLTRTTPAGAVPSEAEFVRYRRAAVYVDVGGVRHSLDAGVLPQADPQEVAVRSPYFAGLPALLMASDLVSLVPATLALQLAQQLPLDWRPLPDHATPYASGHTSLIWNGRVHRDPAITWLRSLFGDWLTDYAASGDGSELPGEFARALPAPHAAAAAARSLA